jgi:choline dehydrogenase-like flavoprotein
VVGAGGGTFAGCLAEAGFEVIVLEAGPRLEPAQLTDDEGKMTARLYTMHVRRTLFKRTKSLECLTFHSAAPLRALTGNPRAFGGPWGADAIAEAMEEKG